MIYSGIGADFIEIQSIRWLYIIIVNSNAVKRGNLIVTCKSYKLPIIARGLLVSTLLRGFAAYPNFGLSAGKGDSQ